jgi:hypothetical protein
MSDQFILTVRNDIISKTATLIQRTETLFQKPREYTASDQFFK